MLGGTFFTAVSQILLKQSSNIKYENKIIEYLNFRVILSYGMFFLILLLNTWCYTKVEMRYGPVIDTAAYVFVLILSRLILKEKITKGKILGNLIIITGILIYTLEPEACISGKAASLWQFSTLQKKCLGLLFPWHFLYL